MGRKRSNHYIDPDDFYNELLISLERDELTDKAVYYCKLLIDRVAKCNFYKSKEDEEDCKAHAMYNILKYWRNFNPDEYKNPFNYFTSYAWTGLAQGWNVLHPKNEIEYTTISLTNFDDN